MLSGGSLLVFALFFASFFLPTRKNREEKRAINRYIGKGKRMDYREDRIRTMLCRDSLSSRNSDTVRSSDWD